MQILCIKTSSPSPRAKFPPVIKGEIYNTNCTLKDIYGLWYKLEERGDDIFHNSLFIDLPKEEGQVFSKKVEEPETIEV